MELVRWFAELGADDLPVAGGKGANLGEMARAGLPVPPGFVLLTPAYRAFVVANNLQGEIERLAAGVAAPDGAGTTAVEAASAAIRALFDRGQMPPEVAEAVVRAYRELGGGPVAVRSSATAEDLPGASFAGQQETYLNISGPEALLEAVRRCWSSLWTPRAISYRLRQGIGPAEVALAVVVQQLVPAEVAGVLFTANPVNGRRDQMVIDGAWGLGEAVVSGQVTPDHWVADAATGAIREQQVARKAVMTVRIGGGGEGLPETAGGGVLPGAGGAATVPVPAELQERPVLDAAGVRALVEMGRRVAAHYGSPQDIEWAMAGGRFYLLQARPITTLYPLPAPEPPPEAGLRAYICFNILQGFVEPFTPMGVALFARLAHGPAALMGFRLPPELPPPAFKVAAGRIYLDVTSLLQSRRARPFLQRFPALLDRPTAEILQLLAAREPELAPGEKPFPARPPLGFLLKLALRGLWGVVQPHATRRRALAACEAMFRELEAEAGRLRGLAARQRFVQEMPAELFRRILPRLFPAVIPGLLARFKAEARVEEWLGDAAPFRPVLRSLPHNPTTEMDLDLWRLSRTLKAEGAGPSPDHLGVQAFLRRYGHRAVREIDVGMPRWSEDPAHVLNVLRTYLSHSEGADPEAHFRQGEAEAEAAAAALVERVRREKGPVRASFLRFLLSRTRATAGMREYPKFYAVRFIALHRRVLLGAGEELVAAGRLERPEDVFFLDIGDLTAPGDLRARVRANRAAYERELARRAVPRVVTSRGETFYVAPGTATGALLGTPASPGVYEGRVRIIYDPRGAQLEPGEVLVAPGTDPAWTPLFFSAGALVMEIGGTMSHGSVVAREYGIPAVVGVTGATERLRTGQRVRVDGEAGQVIPLD